MDAAQMERPQVLIFSGSLDLRSIDVARDRIVEALRQHDAVVVDCAAVSAADVSAIQLLLGAHRSAQAWGKSLVLAAPADGALREVLVRGGFLQDLDGAEAAGSRFWNEGSAAA